MVIIATSYRENLGNGTENRPRTIQVNITGGTIMSEHTPYGFMPISSGEELLRSYAPDIANRAHVLEIMREDSTDMHFDNYKKIAENMVDGRSRRKVLGIHDLEGYAGQFNSVIVSLNGPDAGASATNIVSALRKQGISAIYRHDRLFDPDTGNLNLLPPTVGYIVVGKDGITAYENDYQDHGVRNGYTSQIDIQGTDSMTYAAAFLALRLPFKDYSVILVGSMLPMKTEDSDAYNNLKAALAVAQKGLPGTYVAINDGEVMRATRAFKTGPNTAGPNRPIGARTVPEKQSFESIHYPVLFNFSPNGSPDKGAMRKQVRFRERSKERSEFFKDPERGLSDLYGGWPIYLDQYEPVYVLDLHTNFEPDELDQAFKDGYKAVVIKAAGTGGLFNTPKDRALVPKIKRFTDDGRFVAVTSRVLRAIVNKEYEVNRRSEEAGAVICYDMHSELVIAKTELAAGIADTPEDFRMFMLYNFEDEVNEDLIPPWERTTNDQLAEILKKAAPRQDKRNGNGHNGFRH